MKLQIGFNRRFDANFARVRRAVACGEIGTPHLVHHHQPRSRSAADFVREGLRRHFPRHDIHDFDMARFLIGDEVEEIYTAAAVRVDPAIGEAGDSIPR